MTVTVGQTLLNYRIMERLGAGGQGTVYRALDAKLNRTVVIKVLAPELTAKTTNLRRFEREAQLASSLDHPNICTIYGLHEHDGLHFIVMQYVEGKNVRDLVNGRPLELRSALSIAAQTSDALAAAHSRGIIHRDIKAGNVMVTEAGLVKVLDFGLAKLVELSEQDGGKEDIHLTEVGIPYGTATYAAPEQARGEATDARTDIFSTGVLLYEMLAGTWPFRGKSSVEVRYAVLHDEPRPVEELRGSPPPPRVARILERALAKRPEARFGRADELRDELQSALREATEVEAAGGVAASQSLTLNERITPVRPRHANAAGGASGTLRGWWRKLTGAPQQTSIPPASRNTSTNTETHRTPTSIDRSELPQGKSVAILPFRNLSGNTELGFYEFSLADAVITELARLRSLVVRPSSVMAKYQGDARSPLEIGRELSVSTVLAASFLQAGERLRVTAQLLDTESGALLWSDRIDASSADVLTLQDTIATRIVEGLHLEQSATDKQNLTAHATTNAAAYEEYLRGRDRHGRFIYHTLAREDSDKAIEHFERAVALDPSFALAHCALGAAHTNRVIKGFGSREDFRRGQSSLERALELDSQLLEARMNMVFIYLAEGQKDRARAWSELMSREAPQDTGVHFVRATIHRLDGEHDAALKSLDRMLRLNPAERVVVSYNRARIFIYQGRFQDALAELDQGVAVEPHHPLLMLFRAATLHRMNDAAGAIGLMRDVLAEHPGMDGARPILAAALSSAGRHEEARAEITERVRAVAASDHDIAYWLACVYALEGDAEEAFRWLEQAIELGNENRPWFEVDALLENIRGDARFTGLMERIAQRRAARL